MLATPQHSALWTVTVHGEFHENLSCSWSNGDVYVSALYLHFEPFLLFSFTSSQITDKRVSRLHGLLENLDGQLRLKPVRPLTEGLKHPHQWFAMLTISLLVNLFIGLPSVIKTFFKL